MIRTLLVVTAFCLGGCKSAEPQDSGTYGLIEGPSLSHEVPVGEFVAGLTLDLSVIATDPDGIDTISVYYRTEGDLLWETLELESEDEDLWVAQLSPKSPVLEYYFIGKDASDYRVNTVLPVSGEETPFQLPILVAGVPAPFIENFDQAVSRWSLYDLGWTEYSIGFQGAAWELSESHSFNGSWSAHHSAGTEEETISDWLVSPAVDLSSLTSAQVTWYHKSTGQEADVGELPPELSLWVSTVSGNPTVEGSGFQKVTDVTLLSSEEWAKVPVVDLTLFAGEQRVYLAWNFSGNGRNWFIDQVAVEEFQADLELISVVYDHVDPGGTTNLNVELLNRGSETVGPLTVWVEVDPVNGSASSAFDAGTVSAGATTIAELSIDISEDYPDNYSYGYVLWAEDDAQSWSWDLQLVVGDASQANLQINTLSYGLVQMWLGTGDPSSPTVELPVLQDLIDVGTWDYELDLTNYAIYLPPDVGVDRWWVKVDAAEAGSLTGFTVNYDGTTYISDDLGSWLAGEETLFYLPRQPLPVVYSSTTDTTPITPASSVDWSLTIQNKGGATKGLTIATVSSADPDVVVTAGGPFELATDGWLGNSIELLDVEFDVSVDQNDSTPILFTVTISDEDEAFEVTHELEVPWALLVATDVVVDDWSEGNGDGILDVGETISLEVGLTNLGDADTGNSLECTLSHTSSSTTISFDAPSDYYSYIAAGSSRSENDFSLTLDAGTVGDVVTLDLLCVDGDDLTYPSSVELVIGEPLWTWVDPSPDAEGDALNTYPFDLASVRYRVHDDALQLRFVSYTEYDSTTLFLESWFESPGAGYDWYQVVAQSGVGTLRGYDSTFGFTTIGAVVVTNTSDTVAQVDVDLGLVGLVVDTVAIGFASGFCPSTFFCDHYPNGWGDPYSGMATSSWYTLQW
jgi:hypothetical protein